MASKVSLEHIPEYVRNVLVLLTSCGFQAFIVGGAPRDLLAGKKPHDFDVATDALPGQVKQCCEGVFACRGTGEKHGTVTIFGDTPVPWQVETTTFRTEGVYTDGRRPDSVAFVGDIESDLSRRDFTVNAMALRWPDLEVIDPFGGQDDLRGKLIRAVGDKQARFSEDGLRLMRAIRLRAERGWQIEKSTYSAMVSQARHLNRISRERVRDELSRIMQGQYVAQALRDMVRAGLMARVIPEFAESINLDQRNRHHIRKLDDHVIETVRWVPPRLVVRLAALLHDIAKPRTFTIDEAGQGHFYGHNKLGEQMATEILRRLRFSKGIIEQVATLVREHMFVHGPELSDAGLRRLIGRVGKQNMADLFELRRADIIASGGLPDRWLDASWKRVVNAIEGHEPVDQVDLAIDGNDIMRVTGWHPGPKVGRMIAELFERVMERPELNNRQELLALVKVIMLQFD